MFATAIAVMALGAIGEAKDDGTDDTQRQDTATEQEREMRVLRRSLVEPDPVVEWTGAEGVWPVREVNQVAESEPVSEPVPPEPVAEPTPEPVPQLTGVEAAICAFPWECGIALRVAACESGPDYVAGYNASGHAGTFQVSPIHAWRFAARGLDFWTDALTLKWNLEVAYELWTERWWYAWSCF